MNKQSLRGIRVFRSSLVDSFYIWGKATRRTVEQALDGTFYDWREKERNPVFNRPGLYHDRVSKTAWYEIEVTPGVIRAFYTDWDHEKWVWDNQVAPGDRIMNYAEYKEMKRMFELYDVPRLSRPAIFIASQEHWHSVRMKRDFNRHHLRYEKEHGTLRERVAKRKAELREKRLEKKYGES